jgi:DNA-binding IclR family transcriptional regulator
MLPVTNTPDGDESPAEATPSGLVQSVDRALKLLDVVAAAAPRGETVAVLAARAQINRATAWRLLGTLEAHGIVERDPATNRYTLGLALIRMSTAAGYDGLVRNTRPILERVSAETGETADLAVAGRHGVTYVAEVAPPSVMAINWVAREVPLHATSTGKAFLAWLPPDEVMSLLEKPLRSFTDSTVTDPDALLAELARARSQGYAECAGELEPTLYGVSAPVLNPADGRPLAVFSIWGPVDRVPVSRFPELGPVAIEAAAEVCAVLCSAATPG